MADSKKYDGSTWEHSLRKLTTATDTFTTLPVNVYADGNTATVGISGNTVQSGTPTPDNPIMPQGTGERTGNLVRFYQEEMQGNFYGVDVTVKNAEITLNGTVTVGSGHWVEIGYKFDGGTASTDNVVIPCEPETSYTIATEILDGNSSEVRIIAFGTSNENRTVNIGSSLTTIFSDDINHIFISLGAEGVVFNNLKFRVMFNKGLTPLSYEPYGYKLDISSANTTTPVYLGEVETTRTIKKLVLTGEELWTKSENGIYSYFSVSIEGSSTVTKDLVCSHFVSAAVTKKSPAVGCMLTFPPSPTLRIRTDDIENVTLNDFTSYLARQYAAGTPVTVWYVLEVPTTGIVNEPIRKIGDYADTVSDITVPTITGKDTFDVETALKPSEASLSYTGWHDAKVEEWDGSQWNE